MSHFLINDCHEFLSKTIPKETLVSVVALLQLPAAHV